MKYLLLKQTIAALGLALLASAAHAQVATIVPSLSPFSGVTADATLRLYSAGLSCNGVAGTGATGCSTLTPSFASWTWPCASAAVGSNSAFCVSGTSLRVTGQNANGVLGRGNLTPVYTWATVTVGATGTPTKVVAGLRNTYLLKSNGDLYASGYPAEGRLGITTAVTGQTFVFSLSSVANVFAGENNVYALKTDGSLWAAGDNTNGTLGAGLASDWSTWVQTMPSGVVKVAASATHALVLKNDGSVWVAGRNSSGQFGQGHVSSDRVDRWLKVVENARDIATGLGSSYVIGKNNQLYVAGDNSFGILGAGPVSTVPAFTPVLTNVANMNTSRFSALAVKGDGTLWGTGQNASAELGLGHTNMVRTWEQVPASFAPMIPSIPAAIDVGLAIVGTSLSPAKVLLSMQTGATWYSQR
jgi:alpha-tubulin suppressor-like RCC1 family protein